MVVYMKGLWQGGLDKVLTVEYYERKLYQIFSHMRLHRIAAIVGILAHQIRYLEEKGFVKSTWKELKRRRVKEYSENEVRKIQLIAKYLNQGFKYETAYEKAMDELSRPRLPI